MTTTDTNTSLVQSLEKAALDVVSGAASGLAAGGSLAGAAAGALGAGLNDLEQSVPVLTQIAALKDDMAALQAKAAAWEAAHPIINGLLSVMAKLFPNEVSHLKALIEGVPAAPGTAS